jgi:hypothetical protein
MGFADYPTDYSDYDHDSNDYRDPVSKGESKKANEQVDHSIDPSI